MTPAGIEPATFRFIVNPQGHSAIGRILYQRKIPMTPAGIEPATFRFVAQHLNHRPPEVPKTTDTFIAFRQQEWIRERTSMLSLYAYFLSVYKRTTSRLKSC
jgi:hypothetical protein